MFDETTVVDGLKVHYRMGGNGPHLLLLHGFTLNGTQWEPFLDEFMEHFTAIVPDLPGHGSSEGRNGTFRFSQAAKLMFGLLDQLGVGPVLGIGHSGGAIVLLHMANQQPERLTAMTLIAGAHRISGKGRQLLREEKFALLDADSLAFYRTLHPGGDAQTFRLYEQMNGIGDNYQDFAFSVEELAKISTRTLLAYGDRDNYFPIDIAMELYQALPQARLWLVPGQGHTPIWPAMGGAAEAAQIFPAMVTGFFTGDGMRYGKFVFSAHAVAETTGHRADWP